MTVNIIPKKHEDDNYVEYMESLSDDRPTINIEVSQEDYDEICEYEDMFEEFLLNKIRGN